MRNETPRCDQQQKHNGLAVSYSSAELLPNLSAPHHRGSFAASFEPSTGSPERKSLAPVRLENREPSALEQQKSRSEGTQPIRAIRAISPMRGGSQSQLMLAEDLRLWVVKFMNNPQHLRVLANDFIATRIALSIGLTVARCDVIEVSQSLIERTPQLSIYRGAKGREPCCSGRQFGSLYAGGLIPRHVIDFLPSDQLLDVGNLAEFAGILAFDKWTGNTDGRQAVFRHATNPFEYDALFIDQGLCFGGGDWTFRDAPLMGAFRQSCVYSKVAGWDNFEPWLTRIEQFSGDTLCTITKALPEEWYGDAPFELEALLDTLLRRRSRVRDLIDQFRNSGGVLFPEWRSSRHPEPRSQSHRETRQLNANS